MIAYSNAPTKSFFASIYPSKAVTATAALYPGSKLIYRGYDIAVSATEARSETSSPKSETASLPGDVFVRPSATKPRKRIAKFEEIQVESPDRPKSPARVGNEELGDVTDLILIIHGIGQGVSCHFVTILFSLPRAHIFFFKLVAQYEGFNFVYAANIFRQISRYELS